VHADYLEIGADIAPPDAARVAVSAGNHRIDHHAVAFIDTRNAKAKRRHCARDFVPDDSRVDRKGIGIVKNMKIGTADPGAVDADYRLPRLRRHHPTRNHLELSRRANDDCDHTSVTYHSRVWAHSLTE
jgi:hypothetical protein